MAAASRFVTSRSILVLVALACVVGTSDRAPATNQPANRGGAGHEDRDEDGPQHDDPHRLPPHHHHHHHRQPSPLAHADLIVGHYTLVSSQRVTKSLFEFTYRARLTNAAPAHGPAALDVTARASSHSAATQIVDGELTFGD